MSETENVLNLLEDIRRMICKRTLPDGSCHFDVLKVRIALEMAKHELEKGYFPEDAKAD